VDEELKKLSRQETICREVVETISSTGWKATIEPILDRMVIDVLGGKIGDTWVSGKLDRAKKEERREFYIGYKQALIDFISRVKFHQEQLGVLEDRKREITKLKENRYMNPMEGSRYAP